jgi:hypothetical protein
MAAELENFTTEEQRFVIRLLWAESVPGAQIHQRMCAQYGYNALSRRVVHECMEIFKIGRKNLMQSSRAIQPQPQPHRIK